MNKKRFYEINGDNFDTLEEFFDEISKVLIPGAKWGRNLDAFNDILRGGFGTPEEGFVLKWVNSARSKQVLGYPETIRQLEKRLERCHPSNIPNVHCDLDAAKKHRGPTVFDWLIEIIRLHGPGGEESEDNVELLLE